MGLSRARLWLLALPGLLAGCGPDAEPAREPMAPLSAQTTAQGTADALGADTLSAEIRRIKDLIAEDRITEAKRDLSALKRTRAAFPANRQIEIDRLDALCSAME
jgi:hypothetical protein